jgi:NTE family protein
MSSPSAVLRAARRPFSVRPGVVAAALLPAGTVPTEEIAAGFDALCGDGWPAAALWLCAVRLRDGRLAVFGRDGDPSARIGAAVAASCAIPSFFAPVEIDGERYVDGGAHSPTNADLLARMNLDLVVISAPMAMAGRRLSAAIDAPARRWSRVNLDREARRIRRRGTPVLAWCPTPDDRSVMGLNAMDPARRAAVCEQARVSVLRRLERPDERFSLLGVA